MRILIVEDDKQTAEYASKGLTQSGHVVDVLSDGKEALAQCKQSKYDVLVVDRMLPSMDGLSLVKSARASGVSARVLFLTTMSGIDDRVDGLNAGGDDYLTKPYVFSELLARVNALARRPVVQEEPKALQVHNLTLDLTRRTVVRDGVDIELQPRESVLLEVLMQNKGRVVSRNMLLERAWDFHFEPKTNVVETHISRLRAKIDKPFEEQLLHTIRNLGYSLREPD